ncbi:unnamed protein product, partial [Didymodactylos carnosus]
SPSGYIITLPGDPIFPICNASAGNSSQAATAATSNAPCTYFSGQGPDIAIDNITTDHYVVFGNGPNGKGGIGTGFYVSPSKGATNLTGIQFFTAALPTRDPTAITVEGSNANSSLLTQGSSWILLYSGTAGITVNTSTNSLASFVSISTSTAYTSYRVIATDQLANDSSTQYAEVYLYGSSASSTTSSSTSSSTGSSTSLSTGSSASSSTGSSTSSTTGSSTSTSTSVPV